MSQVETIANILKREGRINNFDAIEQKLTLRLAARINDLRRKGWKIRTEEHDTNCIYILESEPVVTENRPPSVPPKYLRESVSINPQMQLI